MRYGMLTEPKKKNQETGDVLLFLDRKEVQLLCDALKFMTAMSGPRSKGRAATIRLLDEFDLLPIW